MEQNPSVYLIEDADHLRRILDDAGFPLEKWGEGPTKTYQDLWDEIADGESELTCPETFEERNAYGDIIRRTNVLGIDVFAEVGGVQYRLREDRQVFKNGKGERRRDLITSIGEKIKRDEDHGTAVLRAIQEELGVSDILSVEQGETTELWKITPTYPELPSKLDIYKYSVTLGPEAFRPEGYIEDQETKQIFFVWDQVA